ncbi:MAG: hypothetical protein JNJ73_02350 [Hyphomonadaceae bacterium]|nr:hypothetical protein [Hyphomonadaceae bacterium]
MKSIVAAMPTLVRYLLGFDYIVNGLNWWVKIITPYPSISDFVHFLPRMDMVGVMIEEGFMFDLVKAIELLAGIALVTNCYAAMALVVAMTVTVPVFIVDVFQGHMRLRAFLMGTGALVMNLFLLCCYFDYFRPLFTLRAHANMDPRVRRSDDGAKSAALVESIIRPVLPWFGAVAIAFGLVMCAWLCVMIVQHAINPQTLNDIRPMQPR